MTIAGRPSRPLHRTRGEFGARTDFASHGESASAVARCRPGGAGGGGGAAGAGSGSGPARAAPPAAAGGGCRPSGPGAARARLRPAGRPAGSRAAPSHRAHGPLGLGARLASDPVAVPDIAAGPTCGATKPAPAARNSSAAPAGAAAGLSGKGIGSARRHGPGPPLGRRPRPHRLRHHLHPSARRHMSLRLRPRQATARRSSPRTE